MVTKIGLDLGYANITVSDCLAEIYREPSVALMCKKPGRDKRILSCGKDAFMAGADAETSEDYILVRPFKNGLLYDHQVTSEVIQHIIRAVDAYDKVRCMVGVPSDFLAKQERELGAMLSEAGVDTYAFVSRPVAALIGAGYSPAMSVISVNIGAQATEVAVMHNGSVILSSRTPVGGEDFDIAVKDYILNEGDVSVSLIVARSIKERLGAVWPGRPNDSIDIDGTLSLTGGKIRVNLTTEDIVGVFEEPLRRILEAISNTVKQIPTEYVRDIFENGIVLTGGGAELFGIDKLISKVLGISVTKSDMAMDAVAKGLARVNAFTPVKAKISGKNITADLAKLYETSKKERRGIRDEE